MEPYQTPEFEKYTYIIRVETFIIEDENHNSRGGQSIKIEKNTCAILKPH
jgi:hypothetical protein